MNDKIKKFFTKKKNEMKFKMAGPGHKLSDEGPSDSNNSHSSTTSAASRVERLESEEMKKSAEAALARLSKPSNPNFNTSKGAIQAQVRKELEREKKEQSQKEESKETEKAKPSNVPNLVDPSLEELDTHFVARNVYFRCPSVSPEVLTRDEWKSKIRNYVNTKYGASQPSLAACLIIQSCNHTRGKIDRCVETLSKYLENIINNPDDDKYHKIRTTNRAFTERIAPIDGAVDFLMASGFKERVCRNTAEEGEETYLVFERDLLREPLEQFLNYQLELLHSTEPITLELDRNKQVLKARQAAKKVHLPDAFYALTIDEIKREHKNRMDELERSQTLMTSAMREKESSREMRKYKFAIIRVRLNDSTFLQGTFSVYERYSDIDDFVRDNALVDRDLKFTLVTPELKKLDLQRDGDKTLVELKLVPATVLNFTTQENRDTVLRNDLLDSCSILE